MKLRNAQSFLSLYYEPNSIEIATGEVDAFAAAEAWKGQTKQLGQVSTPQAVAHLMASWVMSGNPKAVLDPAAGFGALLTACRQISEDVELVGVERDPEAFRQAKSSAPRGTKLILADYLKSEAGLFDGIIANPPYVKAHRLDYAEGDWRYFEDRLGTPLDRLTNLYALFLLKIWEDLVPNGRAAVLLPAEFLNANFGMEIKERLVGVMRPAALLVFATSVSLFEDALTTSAIVLLEKRSRKTSAWLKKVVSIDEAAAFVHNLCAGSTIRVEGGMDLRALDPRDKWLNALLNGCAQRASAHSSARVGDYFACRRGIATGANDYFCLTASEMHQHDLTDQHVERCITKATDAEGMVFTPAQFELLVSRDRRCFLLNPSSIDQSLTDYLKIGETRGIPKRHLPKHRPTWYRPENRAVADIWVAVFSRESVKFILNGSGAKNLTCFHGLYAKKGYENHGPLMTLFLNSSGGREAFSHVNRFYGDGLNKLEPKDVEAMPCPAMPEFSAREAAALTAILRELETLPLDQRIERIDNLVIRYYGVEKTLSLAP